MNEIEILKVLMKKKGFTHKQLAKKMGLATHSGVSNRLKGKSVSMEVLIRMLDAMDCEIVIRDTIGDKDIFVVTNDGRLAQCQDTDMAE